MTLVSGAARSSISFSKKDKCSLRKLFIACLCITVGVNVGGWISLSRYTPATSIFEGETVPEPSLPTTDALSTDLTVTNISNPSNSDGFMFLFGSSPDTPLERLFALQSSVSTYSFQTNRRIFFWCPIISHGQGNNVLHYWFARSVAFWLDMEFVQVYPGKTPEEKQAMEKIFSQTQTSEKIRHVIETKLMPGCLDWNNPEQVKWMPNFVANARMKFYFEKYSNKTFSSFMGELLANMKDKKEISEVLMQVTQLKEFLLHSIIVNRMGMDSMQYEEALKNKGLIEWLERTRNSEWFRGDLRYSWYQSRVMILYLHEVFRQFVVAPEMEQVWKKLETQWIEQSPKCKSGQRACEWDALREEMKPNDLVVHYRCGDIIASNVDFTGFLSLNYHRQVLKYLFNRFGLTKDTKKTAYILFSIVDSVKDEEDQAKKNYMTFNREDHVKCRQLFNFIKEDGFHRVFRDEFGYNVKIITDGSQNEDTYRMSIAPFVICSVSTFCTHATLGSVHAKAVVQPSYNLAPNFRDLLDGRNRSGLEGKSKWRWNFIHFPTTSDTYMQCGEHLEYGLTIEQLGKFIIDGTIERSCDVLVATRPDPMCGLSTIIFTWSMNYMLLAREKNKLIWLNYTSEENKLFYDPKHGRNIWEYYLEPINPYATGKCKPESSKLEWASTRENGFWEGIHYEKPWAIRPWPFGMAEEFNKEGEEEVYNHTWFGEQRYAANKLVNERFRWKPFLIKRVNDFYEKYMKKNNPDEKILGVHMRGSDKASGRRVVRVEEYFGYIMSWLKFYGIEKSKIFFATDDKNYLKTLHEMWQVNNTDFKDVDFNDIFISQRVTRSDNTTAVFNMKVSKFDIGVEVLTDILLLAKCDCMLSSASAVSESSFYVNPDMHHCSVHLEYFKHRNEPKWAEEGARIAEKLNVVVYRKPDFVD